MIEMRRLILSVLAFASVFVAAQARKVTGSVMCGETKLEGVIVTDGEHFTRTARNGKFAFDINDNAEFVYIVTPSGYVADWQSGVPAFYKSAPGVSKFDFALQRTAGGNDYNIIAIADPQTYSDEHFAEFAGKPMADLCKTAQDLGGVTVGLSLGDISWDRIEILDMYKKEIVRTGVPFYPVVGNHDNEAYVQGDNEAAAAYRSKMGPENYAFCLGKDVVIVLDNIIYDTNFKMALGYTDQVIAWVKGLLKEIPSTSEIYVAQHVPMGRSNRKLQNQDALISMLRGRKVTVLSGHMHTNSIRELEKNMTEHNVAGLCGAWWETQHCTDGTPRGYKVFTKHADRLSWYYKPIGFSKKHIAEAFGLGMAPLHPNSVVVNVWDWDPQWKVEWYEDGKPMGKMDQVREICPVFDDEINAAYEGRGEIPGWKQARPSGHNFAATPSRYAKKVTIVVESRFGQKWTQTIDLEGFVEKHVRCEGAGATIENILQQVDNGATFLTMDLSVAMNADVTVDNPDGPLMIEVLDKVDEHVEKTGRSTVGFNFEIHTANGKEEGKTVPYYHDYADYVMADLWIRYMGDRLMITGSDYRSLNHLNEKYPEVDIAFKLYPENTDAKKAMSRLKFTPKWLSAHWSLVNEEFVEKCHSMGSLLLVWGIPDEATRERIASFGVDAVEYPRQ